MYTGHGINIYQLNEQAITVEFGNSISITANNKVLQLNNLLLHSPFEGLQETIPAYTTLTIFYDLKKLREHCKAGQTAAAKVITLILSLISLLDDQETIPSSIIRIPVCYEEHFAPDLQRISAKKNILSEKIIELHTSSVYYIFMTGFMPGFPYMGLIPEELEMPRLDTARQTVAAGSVGIAGLQTGIYPFDSPGGWNIIGRTPLKLFDATKEIPCLLKAGDSVQFYAIGKGTFNRINEYGT